MKMDLKRLENIPWYWFLLILVGGFPFLMLYLWDEKNGQDKEP